MSHLERDVVTLKKSLNELDNRNDVEYLASNLPKTIYLFVHYNASKLIIGLFVPLNNTAQIFVLDSVRTNNMPNLNNLLNSEREKRLKCGIEEELLPSSNHKFEVKVETVEQKVYKALERSLQSYKVRYFKDSKNPYELYNSYFKIEKVRRGFKNYSIT